MAENFNVIWISDTSKEKAKRIIRSKASASGWRDRQRPGPTRSLQDSPESAKRKSASRLTTVEDRGGCAKAASETIPPPVAVYEPQKRLLPMFLPRLRSLVGPDTCYWINETFAHSNDHLMHEAYDCLIVGLCSNLQLDPELRNSAIERYGRTLRRVQSRVNDNALATTRVTSLLVFLLGMQEAVVWKSFRNSQSHIQGWGRLVQLRGAHSFASPADLSIFRVFRMNAVAMHLLQRQPLFLASEPWTTAPWTGTSKDLFDRAYDLLVQLPGLVANVDRFQRGELAPAQMHMEICGFLAQLNSWTDDCLYPVAASLNPLILEWDVYKAVGSIHDGSITDFSFARGLAHYLAAIVAISRFGPRYTRELHIQPVEAVQGILTIVEKQALGSDQGALWPWLQPLRIAHFASMPETDASVLKTSARLERQFSWSIIRSERYDLYNKAK